MRSWDSDYPIPKDIPNMYLLPNISANIKSLTEIKNLICMIIFTFH